MDVILPSFDASHHPHGKEPKRGGPPSPCALIGALLAAAFPLSRAAAQAQPVDQVAPGDGSQREQAASGTENTPAAAPAPAAAPSLGPSMTGPLTLNSDPLHVDGGFVGKVYVSGVLSGLAFVQDHPLPGDRRSRADFSTGLATIQTADGPVQFFAEVGGYSFPSLGTAYIKAKHIVSATYGLVPVAYVKIAPSSDFNIEAGKLFTLQGAENAFTFQNFNIERGLLWNQTATINRGVQANYAHGPLSLSLSLNDGFYSKRYNWLSGTIGYALSAQDSLTFGAASNLGRTSRSTFATPLVLNNGSLYFLSFTHNAGAWTIQPYVQWEHAGPDQRLAIAHGASTYGAAVLGKYSFTKEVALAARAERIKSTGSIADGAPSLLYGPGSSAWSLTLTPTWQKGIWFARGEASLVRVVKGVPGFELGRDATNSSQVRALVETGIIF